MDLNLTLHEVCSHPTIIMMVIVVGILSFAYFRNKGNTRLPPGPRGYPVIGNMLDLSPSKILENFRNYRKQYGDLFTIYLGTNVTVVVCGYDNLKELFSKKGDSVSDRPPTFLFKDLLKESGVAASSGHIWKIHRIFALKTLRSTGFEKRSIESNLKEEVNVFLNELERSDGMPFCLDEIAKICISNIACSITFGQRFDHQGEKFRKFRSLMDDIFKYTGVSGPLSVFPFLKHLPGDPFAGKRLLMSVGTLWNFIQDIIDDHKKSFDPANIRDYIDAFLVEKTRLGVSQDIFTDEQLAGTLNDIFLAGTDTTSTILKWFVLYLLHNPDVQEKMSAEIEAVVGVSRLPSLNDKANLPYCEAVMTEVFRCADIGPLSVIHCASEDVDINNFTIPKGSFLIQNLESVLMDPDLFPNPEKFRPERFIDDEGKFGNQEKVIVFSIGRRTCLGESLARAEFFLFSTSLVQRFKILPVEGKPMPSLKGHLGFNLKPHSFDFLPVKRC